MGGENPTPKWVMHGMDNWVSSDKRGDVKLVSILQTTLAKTSLSMNAPFIQLLLTDAIFAFTRVCALTGSCFWCMALVAAPESARVTARDGNSSTVEWTERLINHATGQVTEKNHSYVSVGTGLNYQDESGAWRESHDLIELLPDGSAAALRGQHKVHFSPNLNTAGVINLTTVSNRVFRSHPLALYYLNAETGERVLVARIKDSIGEFHPPNQLVYPDCLEGAKADYRVTYTKAGMEADLILLRVPGPEAFGFNSVSARLEWFTEFLDSPVPSKRDRMLKREADPVRRAAMTEPDLVDEILDFQDLWLPTGRAFAWQGGPTRDASTPAEIRLDSAPNAPGSVSTGKKWLKID